MFLGKKCFELDQRYNISWNSLKDCIRKSSDSYVTLIKHMVISLLVGVCGGRGMHAFI